MCVIDLNGTLVLNNRNTGIAHDLLSPTFSRTHQGKTVNQSKVDGAPVSSW
jgi:hypothetical protein